MISLCMTGLDALLMWLLCIFSNLNLDCPSQLCWCFVASCVAPCKLNFFRASASNVLVLPYLQKDVVFCTLLSS